MIPLESYDEQGPTFTGAAAVKVEPNALSVAGQLKHESAERGQVPIQRTFVIGGRLYTLSYLGVLSSNLADLSAVQYTAF